MTIFNRNDKAPDGSDIVTPPREMPAPPVTAEPKRPVATAQPIASSLSSPSSGVSLISKALKITGQLESTEDIRIDGEIDGDVRGVSVTVGSNAKIKGTVYGDAVELSGTVDGKIEAKKVVLTSTARMSGDVIHQDIKIESGAFIDGHCRPEFGKAGPKPAAVYKPNAAAVKPADAEFEAKH
jgi:cytoskeletal protein CcmA (bactofilin family)